MSAWYRAVSDLTYSITSWATSWFKTYDEAFAAGNQRVVNNAWRWFEIEKRYYAEGDDPNG